MKTKSILLAITIELVAPKIFAVSLLDVYNQAFISDPSFKASYAQWQAGKEALPIQRANLLPQLSGTAGVSRNQNTSKGVLNSGGTLAPFNTGSYYSNIEQYSLNLTQPIFNFQTWANVWQAQASVKQAEATYLSAAENLMTRTAAAYFAVLLSEDNLRYTRANKDAVKRMLDQTQHQYEVGTVAITDLENERATYDKTIADEISAVNDLVDKNEQLAEITGIKYTSLDVLGDTFPLVTPEPTDIDRWVKAAEQQNFDLAAARFASLAARENIKIQNAGHLPIIGATGGYNYNYNNNTGGFNNFNETKGLSGGLTLSLPIFSGGGVVAAANQATYQYQQTVSTQEQTHRSVVSNTRQAYLGVLSDISKIKADKQTIVADENSLRAMRAGYVAGTRTIVDVLQAQSTLFNDLKQYASDKYIFVNQTLALKQLAGTLGLNDIQLISGWLKNAAAVEATTKITAPKIKTKPAKVVKVVKVAKVMPQQSLPPTPTPAPAVPQLPAPVPLAPASSTTTPALVPMPSSISANIVVAPAVAPPKPAAPVAPGITH